MREAASQILLERTREPEGFQRTFAVSVGAHCLLFVAVAFSSGSWLSGADIDPPVVMSIRLGGTEGPGEGGLTPLGGRPIQELLSLEDARRPQWIQPPTPTQPKMTVPLEESNTRPERKTQIQTSPDEARGRTPTRGSRLQEGTAMADTGAEGIGVGLSTGGLGGIGGELNLGDFCCPQYLTTMIELIRKQWNRQQEVPGSTVVRFAIQRDGTIGDVHVLRTSGYAPLDMSAQRAILLTRRLPPLPSRFTSENLHVTLTFEYRR